MAIDRALKKGSAELYHPLPRRGASRHGSVQGGLAPPAVVREQRGWIAGSWVEKSGERREGCIDSRPRGSACSLAA